MRQMTHFPSAHIFPCCGILMRFWMDMNREKIHLYTGHGPSSFEALHLGHLNPFKFTKFVTVLLCDAARNHEKVSLALKDNKGSGVSSRICLRNVSQSGIPSSWITKASCWKNSSTSCLASVVKNISYCH